jgi:hypothetical protein
MAATADGAAAASMMSAAATTKQTRLGVVGHQHGHH